MLTAGWLVYALVTGGFVALACFALEGLCREHRAATRWIWAAGLLAVALLSLRAVTTRTESAAAGAPVPLTLAASTATTTDGVPDAVRSAIAVLASARAMLDAALVGATRQLPASIGERAMIAWAIATALALLVIAGVHLRIARVRRRWPAAELHGLDVRISSSIGPAVLGVVRAFIVVPRWLLSRSADEQRLVLAHESEHIRGRDHLLLGAACVVAALVPWHPAVWIMLARLRLAIELDCDARVLRRGVAPKVYGTLLIDLASQCSGFTVGATALADEASHLQRRLLAMKPTRSRHVHLRAGVFVATGLLAVLVACEAKLPTSADVQSMDVASAERSAAKINLVDGLSGENTTYYVDGVRSDAVTARAIPENRIASIGVTKTDGKSVIIIATLANGAVSKKGAGVPVDVVTTHMKHPMTGADSAAMTKLHADHAAEMSRTFAGVLFIDGVKVPASDMANMNPSDIASVEVLKGEKALAASNDPAAANGVILVTTKAGGRMKVRSATP